nr:Chain B, RHKILHRLLQEGSPS [Homo sapiens]4WPF_E Chain E, RHKILHRLLQEGSPS [Homo sapiens]
AHKILHRLLQE